MRFEGGESQEVAFKVALSDLDNKYIKYEKEMYEIIGDHGKIYWKKNWNILWIILIFAESIPKFYHYFPETNETTATIIIELLGEKLTDIHEEFQYFSDVTVLRIGLQVVH